MNAFKNLKHQGHCQDVLTAAQNKRIGISPQIRLLIEAIGDTIEDDHVHPQIPHPWIWMTLTSY